MAKRNMIETADRVQGHVVDGYDITFEELQELKRVAENVGLFDALVVAFRYGVVLGHRSTVAGKYKERSPEGKRAS